MTELIKIDNYFNGFKYAQINCVDIPIAGAAGSFDYNNYFYYCFYLSVYCNWSEVSDFFEIRSNALSRLELSIVPYKINSSKGLISFVKKSVDISCPLLNVIYRIEKTDKPNSNTKTYNDLVMDFISNFNFNTDMLSEVINNYNSNFEETVDNIVSY